MEAYYADDLITIYLGDSTAIVPQLDRFDLLLTDPPYGIGDVNTIRGDSRKYKRIEWNEQPPTSEFFQSCLDRCADAAIWGAQYFDLPVSGGWLVWDKQQAMEDRFSAAELCWTSRKMAVKILRHKWSGGVTLGNEKRFHPCQKPLAVMEWSLSFFPQAKTVLDPFMGSGTTLVACKRKRVKAVGIELNKDYCDMAIDRLQQKTIFDCEMVSTIEETHK